MKGAKTMTDTLKDVFKRNRECYSSDSVTHTIRAFYVDPQSVHEPERLKNYDSMAAEDINDLLSEIELLKQYRAAIVERFGELATAATVPVIRLRRRKDSYTNKVFYYLEEITRYLDEPNTQSRVKTPYTDRIDNSTKYEGKARRDAIQAFEAYKKAHPGIIAELDINKASWER
jgi:hypothetical protein